MPANKQKIFHLEIEGEHHYFGSPKAIFDTIGEERLHMKYASFHSNITLKVGDVYTNRRHGWIIRVGELMQAKTNRSNHWREIIENGVADALAARGITEEAAIAPQPVVNEMPTEQTEQVAPQPTEPVAQPAEPAAQPTEPSAPEQAAQPVAAEPEPARKPSRSKKKNTDIPEQLTLF